MAIHLPDIHELAQGNAHDNLGENFSPRRTIVVTAVWIYARPVGRARLFTSDLPKSVQEVAADFCPNCLMINAAENPENAPTMR